VLILKLLKLNNISVLIARFKSKLRFKNFLLGTLTLS
jgi:hypothetical protein